MKWYLIPYDLALENIDSGNIIKCKYKEFQCLYNLPNEKECQSKESITYDMMKNGEWYVYTWAD